MYIHAIKISLYLILRISFHLALSLKLRSGPIHIKKMYLYPLWKKRGFANPLLFVQYLVEKHIFCLCFCYTYYIDKA